MQWTEEQQRAISRRGTNILLSAAAGSGKTTVLVERVLNLVASGQGSIDRMLIVTFTRAASADMRAKLSRELGKRAAAGDERCRAQQLLMDRASISTLHGFCSDFLRTHFESAGVDPAFRVLDDSEVRRLTDEAVDQAIEEAYENPGDALSDLDYARGPKGVREMVLSLLDALDERPDPETWLERACNPDEEMRLAWVQALADAARVEIDRALLLSRLALAHPDCNANYAPALQKDIDELTRLKECTEYSDFYRGLMDFKQAAPGRKKDAGPIGDEVKKLRQDAKTALDKITLRELELGRSLADMEKLTPQLATLSQITLRARELLDARKAEKSGLSYSDLENKTLRALQDDAVAAEMRERYAHIFLDEYQDTSDLQEALIARISRNDNLFMVGDVKQSIYRFRQAEPRLFLEKYDAYGHGRGGTLLPLTMNFRSRPAILDFVNHVFTRAMHGGSSEIFYDEYARLNHGNASLTGGEVQMHLLEDEADENLDENMQDLAVCERQAMFIAGEIRRRMAENPALRYRDFAIITRTKRNVLGKMATVLLQQGIPAFADGGEDFYDSVEILLALALLKLTANRRSDVELIGVLRSPVVGLSAEELAQIRIRTPDVPFCDAAAAYADLGNEVGRQLKSFFDMLESWQLLSLCTDLGVLCRRIFDESGLQDCMSALPGGRQRCANLDHLVYNAARFDQNVSGSLTRFLAHVEKMQQRGEGDDAHVLGENDDVVRLMSAHKSKGLEFPVVFGAMMQRRYNIRPFSAVLAAHRELGLGCLYCDPELQTRRKTLPQMAISEIRKREDRAEELRILYVLLTRARDSLVLVGSVKNYASMCARWQAMQHTPDAALSYLDVIMPALLDDDAYCCDVQLHRHVAPPHIPDAEPGALEEISPDPALTRALLWQYPDARAARRPLKLTVTGLLRELQAPDAVDELIERPAFLSENSGRMTGAERGTAYHRAMQCLDFAPLTGLSGRSLAAAVSAQLDALRDKNRISAPQRDVLRPGLIARFLEGAVGRRLMAAGRVQREWPFNAMMRIGEALSDDESAGFADDEILVQGTIDCCFEEGGEWVLLDYKTDRSTDAEALTLRYRSQLRLYALALERITGMRVKEINLCLLTAGETLAVPLDAGSDAKVPW